jgi:sugar phosphate isomerase/epimerase
MELVLLKSLWGMEGPQEQSLKRIAESGYQGVEAPVPPPEERKRFRSLLKELGLSYIPLIFTAAGGSGGGKGAAASDGGAVGSAHAQSFDDQLRAAAELEPLLVISHTGKDSLPWDEQRRLVEAVLESERRIGVPVGHETHRGRVLFTPWAAARLLTEFAELKLTADFSHWACVCESLLEEEGEAVLKACQRSLHIHGRVGYAEGPQVPDPRAPEYGPAVEAHERWWKNIVRDRGREGAASLTFTPEFGPPDYLHTLPFTRQPVSDLWDICLWSARRFRELYRHALTN